MTGPGTGDSSLYDRVVTVSFSEHLDLLDLHGRAAVASLAQLHPDARVPPRGESARRTAADHWGTLEIWAWSLENPSEHWSRREDIEAPTDYPTLVAGMATEIGRLEASLTDAGPTTAIDYFDRPGTTAEVARVLAHEAITVAHAVSIAAGRTTPTLHPAAASDGIDQALGHWASPEADVVWRAETVEVRATDTDAAWHLSLSQTTGSLEGEFRLVAPSTPAAIVEGPAAEVLWWLHGHVTTENAVSSSGASEAIRALRTTLMHPLEEAPRRRRRWFG